MLTCMLCTKRTKKKLPPADVIPEHHSGKGCKESDCSSNKSDLKINRENEYLESCGNDISATRIPMNTFGVPLAGPVLPHDFRYFYIYSLKITLVLKIPFSLDIPVTLRTHLDKFKQPSLASIITDIFRM